MRADRPGMDEAMWLIDGRTVGEGVNGTVIFPGTGKVKFPTFRFEVQDAGIGTAPFLGGRPRRRGSVGAGSVMRAVERTCSGSRSA